MPAARAKLCESVPRSTSAWPLQHACMLGIASTSRWQDKGNCGCICHTFIVPHSLKVTTRDAGIDAIRQARHKSCA